MITITNPTRCASNLAPAMLPTHLKQRDRAYQTSSSKVVITFAGARPGAGINGGFGTEVDQFGNHAWSPPGL